MLGNELCGACSGSAIYIIADVEEISSIENASETTSQPNTVVQNLQGQRMMHLRLFSNLWFR